MPSVVVNISSIVTGLVIQFLSTLELTVQRHVCSILKHENCRGADSPRSEEFGPLRARHSRAEDSACYNGRGCRVRCHSGV